jgi:uncharacterized protein
MANRVVHFEIHAKDPEKTADFYNNVFGWEITKWDHPEITYWMVMTGPDGEPGGINGGIVERKGPKPEGQVPVSSFVCTLDVSSVDEYVQKVKGAGGELVVPKTAIPTVGWLVYCKDIDGNIFGMMQSDKTAK